MVLTCSLQLTKTFALKRPASYCITEHMLLGNDFAVVLFLLVASVTRDTWRL